MALVLRQAAVGLDGIPPPDDGGTLDLGGIPPPETTAEELVAVEIEDQAPTAAEDAPAREPETAAQALDTPADSADVNDVNDAIETPAIKNSEDTAAVPAADTTQTGASAGEEDEETLEMAQELDAADAEMTPAKEEQESAVIQHPVASVPVASARRVTAMPQAAQVAATSAEQPQPQQQLQSAAAMQPQQSPSPQQQQFAQQ